jgi:hypothetical protein
MSDTLQLVVDVPYTQLLKVGEICGPVLCNLPDAPQYSAEESLVLTGLRVGNVDDML